MEWNKRHLNQKPKVLRLIKLLKKCQLRLQLTYKRVIALVPNAGHPHDSHPENPLHSQPRLMAARPAHHARHCHRNNHSLHLARQTARHAPPAACVLPVVSRHDFCVSNAGYVDEEDLCMEVRGIAVGGWARERYGRKKSSQGARGRECFAAVSVVYTKII